MTWRPAIRAFNIELAHDIVRTTHSVKSDDLTTARRNLDEFRVKWLGRKGIVKQVFAVLKESPR